MSRRSWWCLVLLFPAACGSTTTDATPDTATVSDSAADSVLVPDSAADSVSVPDSDSASVPDSASDSPSDADKAGLCTGTFGTALPAGFIRIDGTVLAVIKPATDTCPRPNRDHVILEVTMGGAAYRVVINVRSTLSGVDPDVLLADHAAPLPAPVWADGFHAGVALDYFTTLGLHSDSPEFVKHPMAELVSLVIGKIDVGSKVSVYAAGDGGDSVHLVHRNGRNEDGAIVLDPTGGSPRFLLFHFANQTF
jgi:hypothetical protein